MFIMLVGAHPFDLEGGTTDLEILQRVAESEARERKRGGGCVGVVA